MQASPLQPLYDHCLPPLPGGSVSAAYGTTLLQTLGAGLVDPGPMAPRDALVDWAQSGLMYLCGTGEQPRLGPGVIPSCARGALEALRLIAPTLPRDLDGARLLTERAALMGLRARGRTSPNGSCHLLQARDGWIALNLAREDDHALLPAWLESASAGPALAQLEPLVAEGEAAALVARGRLLGLPVAPASACAAAANWYRVHCRGNVVATRQEGAAPLVVDLSALWAGPLCSHLLQQAGARVIKVESSGRLDGARGGNSDFYNLLQAGKESVVLDLAGAEGIAQLQGLLRVADIVIEGSRPRALRQLGIDAEALVAEVPGLTWVAISGYGRGEAEQHWVAFGDDAAAAAGICETSAGPPCFCGDALADPLTGIHSALAAWAFWRAGGGVLLDLSLREVSAYTLAFGKTQMAEIKADSTGDPMLDVSGHYRPVCAPAGRLPGGIAAGPGVDTVRVLREFGLSC